MKREKGGSDTFHGQESHGRWITSEGARQREVGAADLACQIPEIDWWNLLAHFPINYMVIDFGEKGQFRMGVEETVG